MAGRHPTSRLRLVPTAPATCTLFGRETTSTSTTPLISPRGETLIDATQITNSGLHKIWHPDLAVDEFDRIHVVWADKAGQHAIMYTASPRGCSHGRHGSDDGTITAIDDTIISRRSQNRDWPALDIDSQNNVHIVWQDNYDELGRFFNQPQIYYSMIQPDIGSGAIVTLFDDTLLTPIIGHKGHPDVVVDANDYVQVAWDDTRGGKVELAFIVDTSGSMYSEWADICTVIYGGNFASGPYFQGIKPMLEEGNMTVYETIYGLGNTLPARPVPATVRATTRTPALAPRHSAKPPATIPAVSASCPGPSTTATPIPATPARTGAPAPTGLAFLEGRCRQRAGQPPNAVRPPLEPQRHQDRDSRLR